MLTRCYSRLHRAWSAGCLAAAVGHWRASAAWAVAAGAEIAEWKAKPGSVADELLTEADRDRRRAAIRCVFESGAAVIELVNTGESLESWLARDGHLDYLAERFVWLMAASMLEEKRLDAQAQADAEQWAETGTRRDE